MSYSMMKDIGRYLKAMFAIPHTAATAGGSGDATEVDGVAIDRLALGDRAESGLVVIAGRATMASGETLTIAANLQDSPNNSDWTDHSTVLATTTVLSAAGGALTASAFQVQLPVDLRGAERYVRVQATPNLSRAGTDTAEMFGVLVLGGQQELPAS